MIIFFLFNHVLKSPCSAHKNFIVGEIPTVYSFRNSSKVDDSSAG